MKRKINLTLLSIALLFNAAVLILNHFFALPDFVMGCLMGIGIGLMLFAFLKNRRTA